MGNKRKNSKGSSQHISRDPPDPVVRFLRKEVHYACPIPDCGNACLTWHHFDPEWREQHHHNTDGMIALCTSCHPKAQRGHWTKAELRSFKNSPPSMNLIRQRFGWSEQSPL